MPLRARIILLACGLLACGAPEAPDDAGPDSGNTDAGAPFDSGSDSGTTDSGTTDSGTSDAGTPVCTADAQCDNGMFCDGAERCAPVDPGAGADGCISGAPPCAADETCDETADYCITQCDLDGDRDDDGVDAMICGGADCDDTDARRLPGALELCDGVDDDCDLVIDESCAGACDPATEAGWASIAWARDRIDACAPECSPFDQACMFACAVRMAAVSPACEACVEDYGACAATPLDSDCRAGVDETCRASVCAACERPVGDCSGITLAECTPCESNRAQLTAIGIGTVALCQTATCTTEECVTDCARLRAGVSAPCATRCLGDYLACQQGPCAGSCANPAGYNCRTCLDNMCAPALAACSGATIPLAACTMAEAQRLRGVASAVQTCMRGCTDVACVTACVRTSASPTPITDACTGCYGDMFQCAAAQCFTECTTGNDVACDACVCANCEAPFVTCAGYRTGLCP